MESSIARSPAYGLGVRVVVTTPVAVGSIVRVAVGLDVALGAGVAVGAGADVAVGARVAVSVGNGVAVGVEISSCILFPRVDAIFGSRHQIRPPPIAIARSAALTEMIQRGN